MAYLVWHAFAIFALLFPSIVDYHYCLFVVMIIVHCIGVTAFLLAEELAYLRIISVRRMRWLLEKSGGAALGEIRAAEDVLVSCVALGWLAAA